MSDIDITEIVYTTEVIDESTNYNIYTTPIIEISDLESRISGSQTIADIQTSIQALDVIQSDHMDDAELHLSAADREKLDSIESGANNLTGAEIISLINADTHIISEANIESTLARKTYVDAELAEHAARATVHHSNINDPTSGQKSALAGTAGAPSDANRFVTNSDYRLTDARTPIAHTHAAANITDLTSTINNNSNVTANTNARHDHSNKSIIDNITAAGSGRIITNAERSKLETIESGATGDMSSSEIVASINAGSSIINDNRIASTIARDSEVTALLNVHTADAVAHHSNVNDPSSMEKAALAGTSGIPSDLNRFVTSSDYRLTNNRTAAAHASSHLTGDDVLSNATTSANGLMSAVDKIKLNNIESGATADMTASEIINVINNSTGIIDDNNIASTIARTSDITDQINTHTANAVAHHSNVNDPTALEKSALAGTAGTPSNSNRFVTHSDARMSNARTPTDHASTHLPGGTDPLYLGTAAFRTVGVANGVAELDTAGKVPSAQLPSFVDDVLEYNSFAALPATGESSKIYVTLDNNKTFRWSGSAYTEISASLALGQTSTTAYRGDRGATAFAHAISTGNPHGLRSADITDLSSFINNNATIIGLSESISALDIMYSDHIEDMDMHFTDEDRAKFDTLAPINDTNIFNVINSSELLIDDNNIASTIARDSDVSSAISTHAGNATAHHSNTNDPTASEKSALAGTSGTPSGTNKFVTNDDSRMTNARTPSSHGNEAHSSAFITAAGVTYEQLNTNGDVGSASGTLCAGNDARLSNARTPTSHVHGNITNAGAIGTTANLPVKTTTSGVLTVGAFGTGATDFAAGNHTHSGYAAATHASTHVTGGSDVIANAIASGNSGLMSGADKAKLDAIEAGATADLTASEIVTLINASAQVINDANLAATLSRTSHVHGNITAAGYLGSTASVPLITGTAGIIQAGSFGSSAGTFCQGNDARLSDARTPTSHTHGNITAAGAIGSTATLPIITTTGGVLTTGSFGSASGTFCQGNDSRLSDARTPTSHAHGNITNTGYLGSTAAIPLITGTAGIIQAGSFGSTSGTFCQGNDSRLSDARTPTSHTHGNITNAGAIGSTANLPVITTTSGVLTVGSFGSAANTFCVGNDSRLSDARAPTSHNNSAHSETYITAAGVTYEALNTNNDVGTGSSQVAVGNHTHTSVDGKNVQTTITNSDSYIPTSGAVVDLFATKQSIFDLRSAGWNIIGKYNAGSGSTATATANYVVYFPLPIGSKAVTLTKLGINITAGATGNFRMGIYSDSGSVSPNTLLYDYGQGSTVETGLIELSSSNVLSANTLYWVALTYSSTPTITYYTQAGDLSIGTIDATPTATATCWRESRSYTTLPASVGSIVKHDTANQAFGYYTH